MAPAEQLDIADGVRMPMVGVGTWRLDGAPLVSILDRALGIGYRLVDTASYYRNESAVGAALEGSGLLRNSFFVTTKIRGYDQGRERTVRALGHSLRRLRLDHVDLLLIHWPLPMRDLYVATWEELIALRDRGLTRAIGVSNFEPVHIERLVAETGVVPAVNQIQCNPAVQNNAMRQHNRIREIHSQAWEPLGNRSRLLDHPVVRAVAGEVRRTPAQVVLRWHLARHNSVVPKTATTQRLAENLDIFGWDLEDDHLHRIDSLDQGDEGRVNPAINLVE
ncbi:aldo/keto reductase [Micromonospora echinospora]|uniref:aldo/keto reductase n=1 Tax=Micromonospora echinospora TaxID=1877 RepID=UPI003CF6FFA2